MTNAQAKRRRPTIFTVTMYNIVQATPKYAFKSFTTPRGSLNQTKHRDQNCPELAVEKTIDLFLEGHQWAVAPLQQVANQWVA